jgi:hypothetical protein
MQLHLDPNERDLISKLLLQFVQNDLNVELVQIAGRALNKMEAITPPELWDELLNDKPAS